MRPIKFRVWDGQRMGYNICVSFFGDADVWHLQDVDDDGNVEEGSLELGFDDMLNYKLMQFTGLHDGEGKEIYEGDVIESDIYGNRGRTTFKSRVLWKFGAWSYSIAGTTESLWALCETRKTVRVIGNIYENPHLIEQQPEESSHMS